MDLVFRSPPREAEGRYCLWLGSHSSVPRYSRLGSRSDSSLLVDRSSPFHYRSHSGHHLHTLSHHRLDQRLLGFYWCFDLDQIGCRRTWLVYGEQSQIQVTWSSRRSADRLSARRRLSCKSHLHYSCRLQRPWKTGIWFWSCQRQLVSLAAQ